MTQVDVLAFGAHPDDIEIAVGGTLLLAKANGLRTGVVDLTRGEMGSRGSAEIRDREAEAAARVLGLDHRSCLRLPDARLAVNDEALEAVVGALRACAPRMVLAPYWECMHPDHAVTGELVRRAAYLAGLKKYPASGTPGPDGVPIENVGKPHRPRLVLHYPMHIPFEPGAVVDVSAVHEAKLEAVRCYASQFGEESARTDDRPFTARRDVARVIESRARHYGAMIGAEFGEPLVSRRPIPIRELRALVG